MRPHGYCASLDTEGRGIFMVSPYLSRPLRSLREALGSGEAPQRRRAESAEAPAARQEAVKQAEPLAPRRPFLVIDGGAPGLLNNRTFK